MDLRMTQHEDPSGQAVLVLSGDFDLVHRESVVNAGKAALAGDFSALVLDLSAVAFIDSNGLSALVQLSNLGKQAAKPVIIRSPSPLVRRLLELTALDLTLTVIDDDPDGGPK
jgi:anti-anti-sigma factor